MTAAPTEPGASRPRRTRRVLLVVLALVLVLLLLVGLLVHRLLSPVPSKGLPFTPGSGPGGLVSARTLTTESATLRIARVKAAKVQYRSTDSQGRETKVSGALFLPGGKAPAGGWRTVAVAHATTGILPACAPSLYPGFLGTESQVAALLQAGYAVAMTDYQGLGGPGTHPYGDNPTAARNVIDSVRALRSLWPSVSKEWAAIGLSQGGGAVWSADELAASYAPGLRFLGAAAVSPASDLSGFVAKSSAGALTDDQRPAFQWILAAIARTDPSFDLDLYRDPALAPRWGAMSQCAPARVAERNQAVAALGPTSLAPRSAAAAAALTQRLQAMAVAQRPLTAPLLVIYGTDDTLVDAAWTTTALERQRRIDATAGATVPLVADLQQGKGHSTVDITAVVTFLQRVLPPRG